MCNLFIYESYSHIDGISFNYISYGTATKFTVDLIDSCVATEITKFIEQCNALKLLEG